MLHLNDTTLYDTIFFLTYLFTVLSYIARKSILKFTAPEIPSNLEVPFLHSKQARIVRAAKLLQLGPLTQWRQFQI